MEDLNEDLKTRYIRVPAGVHLRLPKDETYDVPEAAYLGDLARDRLGTAGKAELLFSLNLDQLVQVPKDAKLKLPEDKTYTAPKDESLAEAARDALGNADKAQTLYQLNKDELQPAVTLPAGAVLSVPQQTWPALVAFGVLVLFLTLVGLGWLFRQPPAPVAAANGERGASAPAASSGLYDIGATPRSHP